MDFLNANKAGPLEATSEAKFFGREAVHTWMSGGEIASSLQNFGLHNGDNLSNNYYQDLTWGGLTHIKDVDGNISVNPLFTAAVPNINDRTRIINTIASEVTNTNQDNVNPKGTPCE